MKFRKTLLFMLWNPLTFIAYFLVCWFLLSASITMSDDPFIYGTLPDAVEEVRDSFENLPWSILKLLTAFSIILEEIINDFSFYYQMCNFVIPLALTFSYREARSLRKGIATERQAWMQWYDRQQVVGATGNTYEIPPLSEHIPAGSYFISARKTVLFMLRNLILPTGHFVCWTFVFSLLALPIPFDTSEFVRLLSNIVIPAAIFTLILSYREARGHLKGTAIERHLWIKWYYQQIKTIAQGSALEDPPSSKNVRVYSYSGEISETLFFMVRNLKPPIIHLTCWISVYALLFLATHPVENIQEIFELIGTFGQILPWIAIIVFIISYREAKGNLKGIAKAHQVWTQWYHRQQETIRQGDTFEELPPVENTQMDSYFKIAQKTVQFMARNPMSPIVHLTYWFTAFFLPYNEIRYSTPVQFLVILALISSYQETRGTVKGTGKEKETWTKWYQRQTEAKEQGYTLAEVPPAINTD